MIAEHVLKAWSTWTLDGVKRDALYKASELGYNRGQRAILAARFARYRPLIAKEMCNIFDTSPPTYADAKRVVAGFPPETVARIEEGSLSLNRYAKEIRKVTEPKPRQIVDTDKEIFTNLKRVFELLRGMPQAREVAYLARRYVRSGDVVDLTRQAAEWMEALHNELKRGKTGNDPTPRSGDHTPDSGNGNATSGSKQAQPAS